MNLLRPRALPPGARIAVVSPASSARPERITRGMESLTTLGYNPVALEYAQGKFPPYFAASHAERLADLHQAFINPDFHAIICTRGGYGSNYLLEDLDLDLIAAYPKPLIGYSDLTVLQTWLLDQIGLVGFHGPMVAADFSLENGVDLPSFQAALTGGIVAAGPANGLRILKPGRAHGTLYGGCLSMLVSTLGTRFAPQTEGTLLFLEDLGTKPYQVDRMLRQMILAGKFDGVAGFIFGEMLDCVSPGADPNLLDQVILNVLDWFDGPIGIGLRSGHVSGGNVTLPFGIAAEVILEDIPSLRTTDAAVQN